MLSSLVLLAALGAAPKPAPQPLPVISAPLGHFGDVVEAAPAGGALDQEHLVRVAAEGCAPQGVYLMRMLGGLSRVLEQLQQWLDQTKGLEKRLFARPGTLGRVLRHLGASAFDERRLCAQPKLLDGYRLSLEAAPKRLCAKPPEADGLGDAWFSSGGRPAAVVSVRAGGADACRLRLSAVLFDEAGKARVEVHGDWGGKLSARLRGDRCRVVDFTFDVARQAFVPEMKSCQR